LQALKEEERSHKVPVIARVGTGVHVETTAGRLSEVAVDPAGLHFFDLESGNAIR
jgi:hypothetical protein